MRTHLQLGVYLVEDELGAVQGPGAHVQGARVLLKGPPPQVQLAVRLQRGGRRPGDAPVGVQGQGGAAVDQGRGLACQTRESTDGLGIGIAASYQGNHRAGAALKRRRRQHQTTSQPQCLTCS